MAGLAEPCRQAVEGMEEELGRGAGKCEPWSRWVVPGVFVVFMAAMAVLSKGFLEADEVNHFLRAKAIWREWRSILDIWGRFGANGLFGLAAPFGITAARLVAVGVTTLTGIATGIIAKHFLVQNDKSGSWIGRHGVAFAWLMLFAQPCFALYSFMVMTEMLLACTWAWAVAILVLGRGKKGGGIVLAGVVLGLGGWMRPEGWIAVAVWPMFAMLWLRRGISYRQKQTETDKQWGWRLVLSVLMTGLPTLLWYLLGVYGLHDWFWVKHGWPWAVQSQYGKTGLTFLVAAGSAMAGWLWISVAIGIFAIATIKPRDCSPWAWLHDEQLARHEGLLLLVTPFLGLFLMHGLLGSFGLFGSMSLPRYFISVAPMGAVLGVMGFIRMERACKGGLVLVIRGGAIVLAIGTLVVLHCGHLLPMPEDADYKRLAVVSAAIRNRLPADDITSRLITIHPYVLYQLDLSGTRGTGGPGDGWKGIAEAPAGTLLITDSLWYKEGLPKPEVLEAWGYRVDEQVATEVDAVTLVAEPWSFESGIDKRVRLWEKGKE